MDDRIESDRLRDRLREAARRFALIADCTEAGYDREPETLARWAKETEAAVYPASLTNIQADAQGAFWDDR